LAAAISLQEAIGQILAEYALRAPKTRVRAIFGASNELVDHLLAGAPGDVFITAEPAQLDRLAAYVPLIRKSRRMIAQNGLAIVGRTDAAPIKTASHLIQGSFKKVALAEPACPLGQYSQVYLKKFRIFDELLPKVVYVDNSRAVLAAVVSGAAAAGLAFSSDAASGGAWRILLRIPSAEMAATYAAALIRRGQQNEAEKLLDFICSQPAARCLRRCGLRPIKALGTPR
jgi:molybdate transport system substrate-binding protein